MVLMVYACLVAKSRGTLNQTEEDSLGKPLSADDFKLAEKIETISSQGSNESNDPLENAGVDKDFFEGDIILDEVPMERAALNMEQVKWPKTNDRVIIPYVIDSDVYDMARAAIATAVTKFSQVTCIDFTQARDTSEHYVRFINGAGCYSYIGRVAGMDYQPISLGRGCGYVGTALHEMMHAIGFLHEHNRPDRDEHITVIWENLVNQAYRHNFRKQSASRVIVSEPYDIGSILHFGPTSFAKRGTNTITLKDGTSFKPNRIDLSPSDIRKINKYYNCTTAPTRV